VHQPRRSTEPIREETSLELRVRTSLAEAAIAERSTGTLTLAALPTVPCTSVYLRRTHACRSNVRSWHEADIFAGLPNVSL
jgi:hypothetical protein